MSEQNTPQPPMVNSKPPEKPFQQYNGVHSSQSSRSSSPSVRLGQIPSSQLPPSRPIPQSQLPPSRSPITAVTQQVSGLNITATTPNNNLTKFSTSTPNLQQPPGFSPSGVPSPVVQPPTTVNSGQSHSTSNIVSGTGAYFNQQRPAYVNSAPSLNQPNFTPSAAQQKTQTNGNLDKNLPSKSATMINGQNLQMQPRPVTSYNQNLGFLTGFPVQPTPDNFQQFQMFKNSNTGPSASQNVVSAQNAPQPPVSLSGGPNVAPQPNPNSNSGLVPLSGPNSMFNQPNPSHLQTVPTRGYSSSQGVTSNIQGPQQIMTTGNVRQNVVIPPPVTQNHSYMNAQNIMPNSQNQYNRNNINSYLPPQSLPNQRPLPIQNYNNTNVSTNPPPQQFPFQQPPASQSGMIKGPPAATQPPPFQSKANLHSNRYPTSSTALVSAPTNYPQSGQQNAYTSQPQQTQQNVPYSQSSSYQNQAPQQQNSYNQQYKGVTQLGYNKMWGIDNFDLLQTTNILPERKEEPPRIHIGQELYDEVNCTPDIFRCTMTKIPENNNLLQKSRLPLGVLIHPFKDLVNLPVIQCNVIVRCRACRTYINPFVFFVDTKRWKCNLCYRVNEIPEEFLYDPLTKTYGDPSRRPEIKSSTLEYIAPAEYMLRPPQPAIYLYLLDISRLAIESGYLSIMTTILLEQLNNIPGDARTQVGFIAYDSALHFFSMPEGSTQPHEMTVLDIDDVFLPTPDNLLVNLKDRMELVKDLLQQLPNRYTNTYDNNSALGAALQVAFKMLNATGGRVTVFQAALPNVGPGALTAREDPSQRSQAEVAHLNPANDFYKRLALECSGQQIAVDLFIINSQYVDIATISGISRFSGGCIHHFPLLRPTNTAMCDSFAKLFRRYLTRKIGFEAVMRIRCTRGLGIHTFHGNFFVRSTDLLSLPNINPDAGFGMQVSIEESLSDVQTVCFQAALLYTSSKGERRIRVHTMCLPVVSTLHDVIHSADQQCIVGLLSKMAVDRSMQSSLLDAREAFMNVAIDILASYKLSLNNPTSGLMATKCIALLPLYISAMLKHTAFRAGGNIRLDDRVMAMIEMKTKPLYLLLQQIYPDLYPVHELESQEVILNSEEEEVPQPPRLQLTARCLESKGAFLMDADDRMYLLVCPNVSLAFLNEVLGVSDYSAIPDEMYQLPMLQNLRNRQFHLFVNYLNDEKPYMATLQVLRDNSPHRMLFFQRLIEDRMENALSYHEFLQHIKTQVK